MRWRNGLIETLVMGTSCQIESYPSIFRKLLPDSLR
jgi:hypothetical protein